MASTDFITASQYTFVEVSSALTIPFTTTLSSNYAYGSVTATYNGNTLYNKNVYPGTSSHSIYFFKELIDALNGTAIISVVLKSNSGITLDSKEFRVNKKDDTRPPYFNGSDSDIGNKTKGFSVQYQIYNPSNITNLKVYERLNGTLLTTKTVVAGSYTLNINEEQFNNLENNREHTIELELRSSSYVSYRRYTFTKTSIAPCISGTDTDLGEKNSSFDIKYYIENEGNISNLVLIEKLNGELLNQITNPQPNKEYVVTISESKLSEITSGVTNTISIELTGNGFTAYRRYTFVKTDSAPVISGRNSDLGSSNLKPAAINYTVIDKESSTCTIVEKLNNKILRTYTSDNSKEYKLELSDIDFIKAPIGTNTLTITATDNKGQTSTRIYTFTRICDRVEVELKTPIETSIAAKKILVTPKWQTTGGVGQVLVCNNGYDETPTWEDATSMVNLNKPFLFTNTTKTASNWGINIKIKITKNEGYDGEISLNGFGGAFE